MKYIYPASVLCDFYKISHREQYPPGTEKIYSTWTPRMSRIKGIDEVVFFGLQAFVKEYLIRYFNENFFNRDREEVVKEYERVIQFTLGAKPDSTHIRDLHKLGYLPLIIRAVPEGTKVPTRVPMLTIENSLPKFFWLTNYIETLISCSLWQMSTSATIADQYKKILTKYANLTGGDKGFIQFQAHDFSMRGMSSLETVKGSSGAHLLSFTGTDSIPGILFLEEFYNANIERELVGTSIPATEHSVMCAYGVNELASYKRLITKVYPKGFVSIVSDTWDLWQVIEGVIKPLRDVILAREGKVVIRPDSGDPVKIVCGDPASTNPYERLGVIDLLWNIFGGTTNEKGYRVLDSHIGCIYGDAITLERCEEICSQLEKKGYASTNMVFGVGSYTYQYNTRDTFGFALKSTFAQVNGEQKFLTKDPITDSGVKKSQSGMVVVYKENDGELHEKGQISYMEGLDEKGRENFAYIDLLQDVFVNGKLTREQTLSEIRTLLNDTI